MENIRQIQQSIIEEFKSLDGDFEITIEHLMYLGENLEKFPEQYRNNDYIVKGCQSKVWLHAESKNDEVYLQGDSNTSITKGLLSLLLRVFDGQSPVDILKADIYFPSKIGMNRFIGSQRSNGFFSMIKQIKIYALAFSSIEK